MRNLDIKKENFESMDNNFKKEKLIDDNKNIECIDCFKYLEQLSNGSIDLILTDPPYQISKKTNFTSGALKGNYTDRFRVEMDFGHWDKQETNEINFLNLCTEFYRVCKKGATVIIFWDLWKLQELATMLTESGFKQLRFIEWLKTNPVPINSQINYLTNAREIAVLAVKEGKPTFNSSYDKGIYEYPIEHNKNRFHPTQKSLKLFEDLVRKHSNEGDVVLDVFLGSGTTAEAAINLKRMAFGCEIDKIYFNKIIERLKRIA